MIKDKAYMNEKIEKLKNISDDELKDEIIRYSIYISESKFSIGFSCYGITKRLASLPYECLKDEKTKEIPKNEIEKIQNISVIIFRLYISFVYLRSEIFEEKLENIPENSKLLTFKEIFGKGRISDRTDTDAQHIRNSISHGTFRVDNNRIFFTDRNWNKSYETGVLLELCEQIIRFYYLAFEVTRNI